MVFLKEVLCTECWADAVLFHNLVVILEELLLVHLNQFVATKVVGNKAHFVGDGLVVGRQSCVVATCVDKYKVVANGQFVNVGCIKAPFEVDCYHTTHGNNTLVK